MFFKLNSAQPQLMVQMQETYTLHGLLQFANNVGVVLALKCPQIVLTCTAKFPRDVAVLEIGDFDCVSTMCIEHKHYN